MDGMAVELSFVKGDDFGRMPCCGICSYLPKFCSGHWGGVLGLDNLH